MAMSRGRVGLWLIRHKMKMYLHDLTLCWRGETLTRLLGDRTSCRAEPTTDIELYHKQNDKDML